MEPGSVDYIQTVQDIRLDHLNTAEIYISDPRILQRVHIEVTQDCDRLQAFLQAVQVMWSLRWERNVVGR